MPEGDVGLDAVVVLAADAGSFQDARRFQFGQDRLHRPFCNADLPGHFANRQGRVLVQQHQHVRVVRQEGPARSIGSQRPDGGR